MKVKISSLLVIILFSCSVVWAQTEKSEIPAPVKAEKENPIDWSKFFIGGNLGASFGNITYVDISPLVGYRFTEKIAAGIGGIYQYYGDKNFTPDLKVNIIGGQLMGRYVIIENLFAQGEYNLMRYKDNFTNNPVKIERLPVGGGFRQRMGNNSFLNFEVMYDLMHKKYGFFNSPFIFRGGVSIGL